MNEMKTKTSRKVEIKTISDTEFTIETEIKGQLKNVFKAYSDPEAIPQWFGPSIYTTKVVEMNFEKGGRWNFIQSDAEGNVHEFYGEYKEIILNEKITWTFTYGPYPDQPALETIEFHEVDKNTTRLFITSKYPTKEARDGMLASGMEDGFRGSMDRLESYVNSVSTVKQKITLCLWFDKQAEEAMNFYVDLFNSAPHSDGSSRIVSIKRYEKGMNAPQTEEMTGKVITAIFELRGQSFMCLDGGPLFQFDESMSLMIDCEDQDEVDYFWDNFIKDGGQESMCGWLKDKFGISWQIVPKQLGELASDPDPVKARRVINEMLKMKKIIVKDLELAYKGYN